MSIALRNLGKRFGNFVALDNINLEIPTGELVALLGPSGSGKTTLLRIISGLETPDEGDVLYFGEDVTDQSARARNVGFVFQHYALFRHMTVFENVAFGLRVRRRKKDEIKKKVLELLKLVRLDSLEGRLPAQLSGGQRQRVALARALAIEPKVLLLDEPFGALDAKVRQELRQWLRRLHDEIHVTSVFVTHDQEEAFEVADRIVVMNQGKVEQIGSPQEIFEKPASQFVFDFLGNVNVFEGHISRGQASVGSFSVDYPHYTEDQTRPAMLYVRPHEFDIDKTSNGTSSFRAVVVRAHPVGSLARVRLVSLDFETPFDAEIHIERFMELSLKAGDTVYVAPKRVRVFTAESNVPDYSI